MEKNIIDYFNKDLKDMEKNIRKTFQRTFKQKIQPKCSVMHKYIISTKVNHKREKKEKHS